jgi:hypothetical protein
VSAAQQSTVAYPQSEARASLMSRRVMSPRLVRALALPLLLGACAANGDFGRLKPGLVADDIHGWVGRDAAREAGVAVSQYPLTDEERLLRDLGYPLIEPPFDRNRWYAIVNEYGVSHAFGWPGYDIARYGDRLLHAPYRSATARYAQLDTDIRNDVVRIPEFFATARRVINLDRKRALSFRYVTAISSEEQRNATARIAENELVVAWVQGSLAERSLAYCNALQRLVIATPSPMAVEVERSLTLLNTRVAEHRVIATPQFGPVLAACGETVAAAAAPIPVIAK